ncbi:MAG: DNA polymerase II large subunit [Candidatus Thorarchaeota archaeon]
MSGQDYSLPKHSPSYAEYFRTISDEIGRIYEIASRARAKGIDPSEKVEIPPAHDLAARVEATLDGPVGIARRIRELQRSMSREEVAFQLAREVVEGRFGEIGSDEVTNPALREEKAADKAVRVALSILTESITAAPLEGIAKVKIHGSNEDRYLALYLAGPIRAAGGTEAAVTVLVADYVRQVLGLPPLRPTEKEVERAVEEVELYARNVHLQYPVNSDLIRFAARHLPIMLTGEPTEEIEVSGTRDLERIETNRVRGGAVLVLNDGVVGRAAKLAKIVNRLNIPGWSWLDEIVARTSKTKSIETDDERQKLLAPKQDYLVDVIAGRPVFSHPSKIGGFRVRYGRSRNTGLAAVGLHPATMVVLSEFLASGTHIRTERPGKGSIVAPVDTIEGPIVLLVDGSVRQLNDVNEARACMGSIKKVLYLGDILIALGEFLENNHPLVPSAYCEEWWSHDLEQKTQALSRNQLASLLRDSGVSPEEYESFVHNPLTHYPTPQQAVLMSKLLDIPLHPRYVYRWNALSPVEFDEFRTWLLTSYGEIVEDGRRLIKAPDNSRFKAMLERIGAPHRYLQGSREIVLLDDPLTILEQLGNREHEPQGSTTLDAVNSVSNVRVGDRLGFHIGARMGRPEKAEARRMKPPVQVLFPVGRDSSTERNLERVARNQESLPPLDTYMSPMETGYGIPRNVETDSGRGVLVELVVRVCPNCGNETFEPMCPVCRVRTQVKRWCSQEGCGLYVDETRGLCPRSHNVNLIRSTKVRRVDIDAYLERVKQEISESDAFDVRGVLGLTSELKIPEYLGKGILRAKHGVYCYRDGTARFDATDAPLTHFTPKEVGASVGRLRSLGYSVDYQGNPLVSDDQILELKVQDIVVSEACVEYLFRVGQFVDDCLEKIYGLDRYYRFASLEDLIGHLVIGLAPHTSAGIVGRIIGFTDASVCYAHPYWHAAKRRNCDGDEDSVMLVMDALLNFSKSFLPAGRGGFMDAPLVLSVILNPQEVDDESHNMDVCFRYPSRFYDATRQMVSPKTFERVVDTVKARLGTEAQYEGFGFTHGTSSIHMGPRVSRYKLLNTMADKLKAQLALAKTIAAVDPRDVAERVLSHHFIRDIRGNLRAFTTQRFHCFRCRRIFRRVPLSGRCTCGAPLSLTVRKKNISKYLEIAETTIAEHGLGPYLLDRLRLMKSSLDSMFLSEQTSLTDFY